MVSWGSEAGDFGPHRDSGPTPREVALIIIITLFHMYIHGKTCWPLDGGELEVRTSVHYIPRLTHSGWMDGVFITVRIGI